MGTVHVPAKKKTPSNKISRSRLFIPAKKFPPKCSRQVKINSPPILHRPPKIALAFLRSERERERETNVPSMQACKRASMSTLKLNFNKFFLGKRERERRTSVQVCKHASVYYTYYACTYLAGLLNLAGSSIWQEENRRELC